MKRFGVITFVLCALVLLATACGGSAPTPQVVRETVIVEKEVQKEVTTVVEKEIVVTPTPGGIPQGGVVQIPLQTQPVSFNPVLALELSAATINNALFASLTSINPETYAVEPYLAESWENSDDLMSWTFHLKENARWHDGTPITAEDVRWTFERILDEEEAAVRRGVIAEDLERVEVVDDHTVRFILKNPNGLFPDLLSVGSLQPLPKHVLEGQKLADATEFNTTAPVGSGPFKMKQAVTGSHFELEAFEDFFLGRPHLDGLIFKIVPEVNVQVAQLKAGELDWIEIEPTNVGAVIDDPRFEVLTVASGRYYMMDWHLGDKYNLFHDPRVRQAMFHAVDRESILENVGLGMARLADTWIPPSIEWAVNPDIGYREYDPEKAKALLAEAGWSDTNGDGIIDKDGESFEFVLLVDKGNPTREQMGLILQQHFQEVGMSVEYVVAERGGRYLDETLGHSFMGRMASRPTTHPDNLRRFYTCGAGSNFADYCNPEVDELLNATLRTADRAEQRELYYQVQEIMLDDPPNLLVYYVLPIIAYNEKLQGVPRGEILYATDRAYQLYWAP